MQKLNLFSAGKLRVTILRLCHELIENYGDFSDTVVLGMQPRGVFLGRRLIQQLCGLTRCNVPYGELDVTFYRDDFRRRGQPIQPNSTQVDFLIEGKRVILIDDVLYTGRTVRAAMDAMLAYGRPASVELLVLVDRRRSRELPVEASYTGIVVDSVANERVHVELKEAGGEDEVYIAETV